MNHKEVIRSKQNSSDMLDFQYTARIYFNRAETMGYWAFAISILSALCIFLPDSNQITIIIIPILLDIISLSIQFYSDHVQKTAAKLRNYFDATVLGINETDYTIDSVRALKRLVFDTVNKNPAVHKQQISNNGSGNPPGVKDWYNLSFDESTTNAVFECQKQNHYWTDELARKRLLIGLGLLLGIIIICIMAVIGFDLPLSKWIPCYFAIIFNQITNMINVRNHYLLMHEIGSLIKIPDIQQNPKQIIYLQNRLNSLREIPVLEINALHKRCNNKLEELYTKMIQK